MLTVCVQMVMKMLTDDTELRRKAIYSDHIIVQTRTKMWIFQYYSETKHQTCQCKSLDLQTFKKT